MERPVVPFGKPRPERADAVRNRQLLLDTVRLMLGECGGAEGVTMDGLAERAGLGKGTVFRRFGTRAGIFRALLDADEQDFQRRVLEGPPPLGPGADPADRLVAYGRERTAFLFRRHVLARAALDRNEPVPAGQSFTRLHIRMLLGLAAPGTPAVDALAVQLTAALEGPMLLYLAVPEEGAPGALEGAEGEFAEAWTVLVRRLLGPLPAE
ncbi:TetR/AcrR family transcriptional regulator [Streptomyces sp. NPDC001941]|uniref:TetR/AcrR family transcriptional regulator n=1 Tax=Streptomyces sp. NPDC001941 TaxID=3154659 RepID=UPI0033167214